MKAIIILAITFGLSFVSKPISLDEIRANYQNTITDEALCKTMIDELNKTKHISPVILAYLGGIQTIRANHVLSPVSKWNTFKNGKQNIETAYKLDPNNVEIRFIRLSVQKNVPSFLGYHSNIKEDEAFIIRNRHTTSSKILQQNIDALLK